MLAACKTILGLSTLFSKYKFSSPTFSKGRKKSLLILPACLAAVWIPKRPFHAHIYPARRTIFLSYHFLFAANQNAIFFWFRTNRKKSFQRPLAHYLGSILGVYIAGRSMVSTPNVAQNVGTAVTDMCHEWMSQSNCQHCSNSIKTSRMLS